MCLNLFIYYLIWINHYFSYINLSNFTVNENITAHVISEIKFLFFTGSKNRNQFILVLLLQKNSRPVVCLSVCLMILVPEIESVWVDLVLTPAPTMTPRNPGTFPGGKLDLESRLNRLWAKIWPTSPRQVITTLPFGPPSQTVQLFWRITFFQKYETD